MLNPNLTFGTEVLKELQPPILTPINARWGKLHIEIEKIDPKTQTAKTDTKIIYEPIINLRTGHTYSNDSILLLWVKFLGLSVVQLLDTLWHSAKDIRCLVRNHMRSIELKEPILSSLTAIAISPLFAVSLTIISIAALFFIPLNPASAHDFRKLYGEGLHRLQAINKNIVRVPVDPAQNKAEWEIIQDEKLANERWGFCMFGSLKLFKPSKSESKYGCSLSELISANNLNYKKYITRPIQKDTPLTPREMFLTRLMFRGLKFG